MVLEFLDQYFSLKDVLNVQKQSKLENVGGICRLIKKTMGGRQYLRSFLVFIKHLCFHDISVLNQVIRGIKSEEISRKSKEM